MSTVLEEFLEGPIVSPDDTQNLVSLSLLGKMESSTREVVTVNNLNVS